MSTIESESPADAAEHSADRAGQPGKPGAKPKGKKDHTGPIIVIVSIVGVVIAWVSYKRQAANGSLAQMVPTSGALGSGTVAGGVSSANNTGLDQLISNLGDLVTQLQTPVSGTVGTPIADNHPVYKRFVDAPGIGGQHGTVFSIENGKAVGLTLQQWIALGKPGFDTVTTQDSDYAIVQQSQHPTPTPTPTPTPAPKPSGVALPSYQPGTRTVKPS